MPFLNLFVVLSLLVTSAVSNQLASPYQLVALWYAYSAEVALSKADTQLFFAPGCKGSAPSGRCTFNEFIHWIEYVGDKKTAWRGTTSIAGTNLFPDVEQAAKDLRDANDPEINGKEFYGRRFNTQVDHTKLLPAIFAPGTKRTIPALNLLWQPVIDKVQEMRQTVSGWDTRVDVLDDGPIKPQMDKFRQAMSRATVGRLIDNRGKLLTKLNAALKTAYGVEMSVEYTIMRDGPLNQEYKKFDSEATSIKYPGRQPPVDSVLTASINDSSSKSRQQQHLDAGKFFQGIIDRAHGSPGC